MYLPQYLDADTRAISTFESDLDLTSAGLPGARQVGENLTVWREQRPLVRGFIRGQ